ncbi:MAG: arabinogalactan endo-1,4-beta-galactosidase [Prevotella sp.]|nr:arabinogalactan endo-1,4-beta-galactosidase [Prevotella sp.]
MKKTLLSAVIAVFGMLLNANAQEELLVGGDISVLPRYEAKKVSYYDQQGKKITDVMQYLKSDAVGWNALRVRLFVDPSGDSDPQVCQDLNYVVPLAKRIKAEGFKLLLDFHYSDTWADPAKQWTPASWLGLNDEQLKEKIYDYTKDCLQVLVDSGATPDYIQTGNEISYGMLWGQKGTTANRCYTGSDANWPRFIALLKQAGKACREVCPDAKIIIHTERAGKPSVLKGIYQKLASVDYDIIGLSYYPFWHNNLATLASSLTQLATSFPNKKVHIVETAYYYQYQPAVGEGIDYDFSQTWPIDAAGQKAFTQDLITELKKHTNVTALYWWFPEENGNGPNNSVLNGWVNRGLWNNTSHKAHSALYELKEFLNRESSGVEQHKMNSTDTKHEFKYYDLQGRRLNGEPRLGGIYIHEAKDGRRIKTL